MKSNILFSLIFTVFFSACSVNVNQPNSNTNSINSSTPLPAATAQPAAAAPRWSVVVCSSRAKSVTLSAGTSETDGETFATWQQNSPQRVFELPEKLQTISRIYLKGSASDRNQVEMCVLFDGKAKKRVEFDDDEDAIIASSDTDELDKCRCTQ